MNRILGKQIFIAVLFFAIISMAYSQSINDIAYGTGDWYEQGLGYHRAVIYADKYVEAAKVRVPWRRLDNVEGKDLILVDALTGGKVKNIYSTQKNEDFGDIVFEPVSGEGEYYLYYMPGGVYTLGAWWRPRTLYAKLNETFSPEWKHETRDKIDVGTAKVIRFESKSQFHSFYPMETPVTEEELDEVKNKYKDHDFLVYTEDRNFPVRMTERIPYRWYKKGISKSFYGSALRNESYAWQIGVFAPYEDLKNVRLKFSDLKNQEGATIPASSLKCINLGGKDYLGEKFIKVLDVPENKVRAMWIITDIEENQATGTYHGVVTISSDNMKDYSIDVSIKISDKITENRGYNTPQNQSRLNWLDSDLGIDNEVYKPYLPVERNKNTIHVLGRSLSYNNYGFPEKITSTFTESNHDVNGDETQIISDDIKFELLKNGSRIPLRSSGIKITLEASGVVAWQTILSSADITVTVNAKMECDGMVNYNAKIEANNDITLDDVQLIIPYSETASKYCMGLEVQGGLREDNLTVDWKWGEYASNHIWLGDVNAGMQLKLKHIVPDWTYASLARTGPYRDWNNNGKGGCRIRTKGEKVMVTAFTGERDFIKGDSMILNFSLAITPFKPLDDDHWDWRYYHEYRSTKESVNKVIEEKDAKIINLHQGNVFNPHINYPFLTNDLLKEVIEKAKKEGIRTKLYYTIRELSVYLPELWALRSLGDEVFSHGIGMEIADPVEIDKEEMEKLKTMGNPGHPWLYEHLRSNFDPAWHDPLSALPNIDWDMAIRTQGVSRWHNYYVEGLAWLMENLGMRGLYLDGIGFDREFMKRIRKTMDKTADGCLIDFHSGNNYDYNDRKCSAANAYMEHFTCVNSLWFGEGYDYDKSGADYWLIEMSGIPFGLYGELINEHSERALYHGMLYGATGRLGWGGRDPRNIWNLWDYFGMSGCEFTGYWDSNNAVKINHKDILASTFVHDDRVLVAMGNWSENEETIHMEVDWNKLGFNPSEVKIEIPEIEKLQEKSLNADIKKLKIPASTGLILILYKN